MTVFLSGHDRLLPNAFQFIVFLPVQNVTLCLVLISLLYDRPQLTAFKYLVLLKFRVYRQHSLLHGV